MKRLRDIGRDLFVALAVLAVGAGSMWGTMYVMMRQPVVRMPTLVGLPLPQAERVAQRAGVKVRVKDTVYDARYPAQVVIEQWPPPGMTIKRGQSSRVIVSRGPRPALHSPVATMGTGASASSSRGAVTGERGTSLEESPPGEKEPAGDPSAPERPLRRNPER